MVIAARLLPRSMLSDPATVKGLAGALGPLVRAVDGAVGEQVAMRVDLEVRMGEAFAHLEVRSTSPRRALVRLLSGFSGIPGAVPQ